MQHWVRTVLNDVIWASKDMSEMDRPAVARIIKTIEAQEIHLFRTEELEHIADGLSECGDLEELSDWMWKATTAMQFQNFSVFVLNQSPGASFGSKICTSYSEEWVSRYVEQGYQFVDPVMTEASRQDGWFCFADLKNQSPISDAFWSDVKQHKIDHNGFCWATTRSDGTRVGVSFSSKGSAEKVAEIVRHYGSDIWFLCQLAADAFCFTAAGPSIPDDALTKAELRFLSVLSTSPNPHDALKLSSGFGSNDALQDSIRRKLKVETVFQAVAIAASRNWFNQLPYDCGDIVRSFSRLEGSPKSSKEEEQPCGPM